MNVGPDFFSSSRSLSLGRGGFWSGNNTRRSEISESLLSLVTSAATSTAQPSRPLTMTLDGVVRSPLTAPGAWSLRWLQTDRRLRGRKCWAMLPMDHHSPPSSACDALVFEVGYHYTHSAPMERHRGGAVTEMSQTSSSWRDSGSTNIGFRDRIAVHATVAYPVKSVCRDSVDLAPVASWYLELRE
jgi:hypothetical protein